MTTGTLIDFYLEGEIYASRRLLNIPQKNEIIVFKSGLKAKVIEIQWVLNRHKVGDEYYVNIFCK